MSESNWCCDDRLNPPTMRAHEWCRVGSRNGALVCSAKFNMHLGREQRSVLGLSAFPLAVLHRSRFVPEATAQAAIAECTNRIYAARFSCSDAAHVRRS